MNRPDMNTNRTKVALQLKLKVKGPSLLHDTSEKLIFIRRDLTHTHTHMQTG